MLSQHIDELSGGVLEEGLKLLKQCPLCKADYANDTVEVIDEYDETYYIHTTCDKCHNSVMAVIVVSPLGVSSIGVVTDLTAQDARRIYTKDYLSQDDVLDFHELLRRDETAFIHSLIKKV